MVIMPEGDFWDPWIKWNSQNNFKICLSLNIICSLRIFLLSANGFLLKFCIHIISFSCSGNPSFRSRKVWISALHEFSTHTGELVFYSILCFIYDLIIKFLHIENCTTHAKLWKVSPQLLSRSKTFSWAKISWI